MKLLAIDTSTSSLSAALLDEDGMVGSFGLLSGRNHSLALLPLLDAMLTQAGLSLPEMDAFAVTIGPGSFTGLRIGAATVQAWGTALDKPLIAVSSSEAMARMLAASNGQTICTLFDARRNEVYAALFEDGERLWPDTAIAPDKLAQRLRALDRPILCGGDGLPAALPYLSALGTAFVVAPPQHDRFLAPGAAEIAAEKYRARQFTPAAELLPLYLRLSEAEEKRLATEAARERDRAACGGEGSNVRMDDDDNS